MWVKICANTNLADAQLAVDLGADALGFVFAPSTRQVTVAQVRAITSQLRPVARAGVAAAVETIGVVQTQDAGEIFGIVRDAGLSGVQLHGGFNLALALELRERLGAATTIAQVLHWVVGEDAANAERVAGQMREMIAAAGADRVLLDAKVGSVSGGSGRSFDWAAARAVLDEVQVPGAPKVILAGGLRPENLAEAIRAVAPWGVDVASGVEASPGVKDPARLKEFLEIARRS